MIVFLYGATKCKGVQSPRQADKSIPSQHENIDMKRFSIILKGKK